ncbi:tetratricopeptide repeat-containing sensor histidine kinase [Flavobacterium sp. U410]
MKILVENPKLHDTTKLMQIALILDNIVDFELYEEINEQMGKLALKGYPKKVDQESHQIYATHLAAYYNNLAAFRGLKKETSEAVKYYDKSISIFKAEKVYDQMNYVIVSKGTFYSTINEYQKAIECFFTALKYFEKNPDENLEGIAMVNSSLATIYYQQKEYKEALKHNLKTINYLETAKESQLETANALYYKGQTYLNCGSCYLDLNDYEKALFYFKKANEISKITNDNILLCTSLGKIGNVKLKEGEFEEAEVFLKEALDVSLKENSPSIGFVYINLGELYFRKNDLEKANLYLSKGLSIAKTSKNIDIQISVSELLYQVSLQRKDYKKALEAHLLNEKLTDSSKIEASKNALVQQQLKYDFEKRELNLKLDSEKKAAVKNNWLIGLSGILLLLVLGVYFYYRNNKQKQSITILEKEQIKQKLLVTQMNPHFIFNSIDNIQGLIYSKKDDEAINYLTKFSKLTRQILENSNENYISLEEEVEMTKNYLSIQQLLYNNKFSFTITVEDKIDQESIFLPPMLTQPFIENAIKHGLSNTSENGKINIHFYLKDSKLFFEVTDNGRGFEAEKKETNHKSLAMTITKERLISYTKNQDFIVHTDNIKDSSEKIVGAKVSFEIPCIFEN